MPLVEVYLLASLILGVKIDNRLRSAVFDKRIYTPSCHRLHQLFFMDIGISRLDEFDIAL